MTHPMPSEERHKHVQRFDGDEPYLVCECGARWDALTGRELRFAPALPPDTREAASEPVEHSICVCGLAKRYHWHSDHEYEPAYPARPVSLPPDTREERCSNSCHDEHCIRPHAHDGLHTDSVHEWANDVACPPDTREEGLREAHTLLWPPHPGDVYQSSALCSCGEWQFDSGSPGTLFNETRLIFREWTSHVRETASTPRPGLDEDGVKRLLFAAQSVDVGGLDAAIGAANVIEWLYRHWPEFAARQAEPEGET